MYGSKRVAVRDLNPHILCALCGGYLIQATTVIECLHSFCRSCIVNFLETSKVCPICDAQIHKTRPLLNIRPDQTLQSLVYKLVPGLFQDEMRRRREFHATLSESDLEDLTLEEKGEASLEREFKPGDDHVSLILQMAFRKNDKKEFKVRDTRYLLCPSEVTIKHLKRFVRCKFQLGENFKIEMFRGGEELTDDLMLQDIALIYSWRGDKPMHICYTVQERASAGSSKVKIKLEQPALTTCREIHSPGPSPAAVDPMREPLSPLTKKARPRTTACSTAPFTTTSSHTSAPPSTVTCHTPGALPSAKGSSSSSKPYLISATTKKTVVSQSVTSIICPTATSVTWPTASSVTCPKTSPVSCPTASSTRASPVKPLICSLDADPRLTQSEVKKESKSSVTSQVGRTTTMTPSSDSPPTLSASWESETAASSVSQLLHSVQSILSKGTKKTVPVVNPLSWTPVSDPLTKQTGDTKLGGDKIDRKVTATLETPETFQPNNHESLKTEALSRVFIKKEADESAPCETLASLKSEKCLSLKAESSKQHECDSSKNDAQESLKNESSERGPSKHRRKHKSAKRDKRDKTKHESRKSSKRGRSSEQEPGACEGSAQSDNNSCAREKRGTSKSKKRKSSKRSKRGPLNDDSSGKSELQKNQPSLSAVESLTINRSSDAPPCEDSKLSKREGAAGVQRSQSALEKPTSWPNAVGGVSGCPPAAAAAGTVEKYQAKESSLTEDTSEEFFHYIPKFQKHRKILPLTRSISCEGQITNPSPVPVSNSDAMEKRNWKKRKLSTMDLSSSSVGSNNFSGDYAPWSVACCEKTSEASSTSKVQSVRHTACDVTSEHSSNNVIQPFSEKVPNQSTSSVYQSSTPDRPPASSSSFSRLPFVPPQNGIFTSSFSKQQGKEESSAFLKTSPRDPAPKINSSNNNEITCGSKNPSTAVSGKNRTAPSRSIKSTSRGNPSNASATNGNKPSKNGSRPKVTDETPAAMMRSSSIHKSLEEICVEISSSPSDVSSVTSPATDVTSPGTEDRADTSALPEIQSDTGCVVHFHGRVAPLDLSSKKKK